MAAATSSNAHHPPILGGFVPLSTLWERGRAAEALFPSEASARWYLRVHRETLVAERALAMHLGRMYVHPERLEPVVERIALEAASKYRRAG
jgi:hypothetical protein